MGDAPSARAASTSQYRPPLGVRHLLSVSARNLVPPGGVPRRLAGVSAWFTLSVANARGVERVVYESERARETLNPDWDPLGDAGRALEAAVEDAAGGAEEGPPRMTLRVYVEEAPPRDEDDPTDPIRKSHDPDANARAEGKRTPLVPTLAAALDLGDLVPVPGVVRTPARVAPSGPRAGTGTGTGTGTPRAGVLSAPPNTPLVRMRRGAPFAGSSTYAAALLEPGPGAPRPDATPAGDANAPDDSFDASASGATAASGPIPASPGTSRSADDDRASSSRSASAAAPAPPPSSPSAASVALAAPRGWYVPGACAWAALRASALEAELAWAFAASDCSAELREARSGHAGSGDGVAGLVRDPDGGQTAAAVFRADFEAISAIIRETRDAVKALERAERARDAARATLEDASASAAAEPRGKHGARAAASRDVSSDPSSDPSSETRFGAARNESASSAARRVVHSRAESKRHRAQVASLRATVREHRRAARVARRSVAARSASLDAVEHALRAARARLAAADALLAGPHGRGRLHQKQRELVATRWRLVGDLAEAFPVARMRGGGGGGGAGPGPGPGPGPGGHAPSSTAGPLAVAGAALDLSLPGDLREGTSRGDARRAAKDKDELDETGVSSDAGEVRGGGEKGSKPSGGNNLRPLSVVGDAGGFAASSAESAAAALGYVAQASLQLASVLDVPLRYPVAPGASRSYICDLQQVQPAEAKAGGGGLGGREYAGGSGSGSGGSRGSGEGSFQTDRRRDGDVVRDPDPPPGHPDFDPGCTRFVAKARSATWRRVEFPLFADRAEATRFTYAVFLLNKDLEQLLNAHGALAAGPRHTLQNLRRLFHAKDKKQEVAIDEREGGGGRREGS